MAFGVPSAPLRAAASSFRPPAIAPSRRRRDSALQRRHVVFEPAERKRPMKTLTLACALLLSAAGARAFDLTVDVTNARSADGFVGAAVYGTAAGWLKDGGVLQAERAAAAGKVVLVFRGLPAGRYALSALHDENGNGKLDANVAGLPTERYGFSRDARGRMGPPTFDDAVFELSADSAITIRLN
jgi:uncharacterized protein (DUF2141 family)